MSLTANNRIQRTSLAFVRALEPVGCRRTALRLAPIPHAEQWFPRHVEDSHELLSPLRQSRFPPRIAYPYNGRIPRSERSGNARSI